MEVYELYEGPEDKTITRVSWKNMDHSINSISVCADYDGNQAGIKPTGSIKENLIL